VQQECGWRGRARVRLCRAPSPRRFFFSSTFGEGFTTFSSGAGARRRVARAPHRMYPRFLFCAGALSTGHGFALFLPPSLSACRVIRRPSFGRRPWRRYKRVLWGFGAVDTAAPTRARASRTSLASCKALTVRSGPLPPPCRVCVLGQSTLACRRRRQEPASFHWRVMKNISD